MNLEYVPAYLNVTLPDELETLGLNGKRVQFVNSLEYDFGLFVYTHEITHSDLRHGLDTILNLIRSSVYPDATIKYVFDVKNDKEQCNVNFEEVSRYVLVPETNTLNNIYQHPTNPLDDSDIKRVISQTIRASPGSNKFTLTMEISFDDVRDEILPK